MKDSIDAANTAIRRYRSGVARCQEIIDIRNQALLDPLASVRAAKQNWLPTSVTKFASILETGSNVTIAKEDYLKAINAVVVDKLKELTGREQDTVKALNKILTITDTTANNIITHDRWDDVVNQLRERTSSLPYIEQLIKLIESRITRYLETIKSNASVTNFLYGVNEGLKNLDIDSFERPNYAKLNNYINSDSYLADTTVSDCVDKMRETLGNVEANTGFTNVQVTPDTDVSTVDILTGIVREINIIKKELVSAQSSYTFSSDISKETVKVVNVLEEDPVALTDGIEETLLLTLKHANKLEVALSDVVRHEAPLNLILEGLLESMGIVDKAVFGYAD